VGTFNRDIGGDCGSLRCFYNGGIISNADLDSAL
jgi:hypothetical protein